MANLINTIVTTGTLAAGEASKLINHLRPVYSKEIQFKAMPIMRFLQFARQKTELGTQPGLTIQMMTYDNLTGGGTLQEGVRMETTAMSSTMKSITVAEKGNAVAVTELALHASFTDIMSDAVIQLGRNMAIVLDCEFRDTALDGDVETSVIYGRANASAPKITSRANITTANPLSVAVIKDGVEILATNNAPKFDSNYYICFVHPHQSRSLRDDSAWINASNYGSPESLFTGEIGRIDDVRFIETTLMCNGAAPTTDYGFKAELKAGASGAPATTNVFQGLLFGEDYYGYAVGLPTELRDDGVTDFGREHRLAWYAIWGTGILNGDRGVVIETC